MRKLLMVLAATGMATVTPTALPTAASAQSNNGALEFCKSVVVEPPQPRNRGTLGECTSFFIVPLMGVHPHACDFWNESGILEDMGFDSYPECVRQLRDLLREEE